MTLSELHRRVTSLNVQTISVDALTETSENRIELNREQLQSGLRSDGSDILPSYTALTIEIKLAKGQETRFVTLKDTGAFQDAIRSTVKSDVIETNSTDDKVVKLRRKYETRKGKLFGLSKDFKIEYIEKDLQPSFNKKVENILGLKMK